MSRPSSWCVTLTTCHTHDMSHSIDSWWGYWEYDTLTHKCRQTEEIGRRRSDFKSLPLPKFQTSFHGSPRTDHTRFHGSPHIFKQIFTRVNGVPGTQKICWHICLSVDTYIIGLHYAIVILQFVTHNTRVFANTLQHSLTMRYDTHNMYVVCVVPCTPHIMTLLTCMLCFNIQVLWHHITTHVCSHNICILSGVSQHVTTYVLCVLWNMSRHMYSACWDIYCDICILSGVSQHV